MEGQKTKRCRKCNKTKPIEKFKLYPKLKYRAARCRKCEKGSKRLARLQCKLECFDQYGGRKCQCCGETLLEFLSLDHIGNSRKELDHKRRRRRFQQLRKENFPHKDKLRVLCFNCNCAIGFFGYCPHDIKDKEGNDVKRIIKYGKRGEYSGE